MSTGWKTCLRRGPGEMKGVNSAWTCSGSCPDLQIKWSTTLAAAPLDRCCKARCSCLIVFLFMLNPFQQLQRAAVGYFKALSFLHRDTDTEWDTNNNIIIIEFFIYPTIGKFSVSLCSWHRLPLEVPLSTWLRPHGRYMWFLWESNQQFKTCNWFKVLLWLTIWNELQNEDLNVDHT